MEEYKPKRRGGEKCVESGCWTDPLKKAILRRGTFPGRPNWRKIRLKKTSEGSGARGRGFRHKNQTGGSDILKVKVQEKKRWRASQMGLREALL